MIVTVVVSGAPAVGCVIRNVFAAPALYATTVEPVPAAGDVPAVPIFETKPPFVAVATILPELSDWLYPSFRAKSINHEPLFTTVPVESIPVGVVDAVAVLHPL